MSGRDDWHNVTKREPCPLCGKPDWCSVSADGNAVLCGRVAEVPAGWEAKPKRTTDGRAVYVHQNGRAPAPRPATPRPATPKPAAQVARDWGAPADRCRAALTDAQRDTLARELGVSADALRAVGLGWIPAEELRGLGAGGGSGWTLDAGAFTVPECDGRRRVVGLSLRAPSGAKGSPSGARRGLVVPATLNDLGGPALAVEGASDVAACVTLGLAAVGRPSNLGGAGELAELLRDREVLLVGERDESNGRWPGREGAVRVAGQLARAWRQPVAWTLPPEGLKDVRAWLRARVEAGLDLGDESACRAAGAELLAALRASMETAEPPLTVRLAPDKYGRKSATLAVGEDGADFDGEDVLHVGRLRIAEAGDRETWTAEAASAALKRLPWLGDADSARERIRGLLDKAVREAAAEAASAAEGEDTPSVAEAVVRLAQERYRFGVSDDGEPFAVERNGPLVALSLRGSATALRSVLAREYRREKESTPSGSALADALTVLAGEAQGCAREPVHLRAARNGEDVVLDLGDVSGRAVVVDAAGWRVADRSPVLFRRTALTAPMPEPERGGDLAPLWELVPVAPEDRDLLLGWLLHAMLAGEPHAIALLGGPQGAGKTTAAEYLGGLVDPSTAPTRTEPRESRQWAICASGSWLVALDNVSSISTWLSDALCRAATGDGWVDRALYTDGDLVALRFQRVVLLTSIDAGALRGDLGDRIVLVDLERIPPERRRSKRQLDADYNAARPKLLGALLDVLVRVLAALPAVETDGLPRMADFARVLAALDQATNSKALERYSAQEGRVAREVAEGDPLAGAVADLGEWQGTSAEMLARLRPEGEGRLPDWLPKSPRALSGRLRRLVATARVLGTEIVPPDPNDHSRRWRVQSVGPEGPAPERNLGPTLQEPLSTAQTARTAQTGLGDPARADSGSGGQPAVAQAVAPDRPNRPATARAETGPGAPKEANSGRSGGSGGRDRPLDAGPQNPSGAPRARTAATRPRSYQMPSRYHQGSEERSALGSEAAHPAEGAQPDRLSAFGAGSGWAWGEWEDPG